MLDFLLIGFGDLNTGLARRLSLAGYRWQALRRQNTQIEGVHSQDVSRPWSRSWQARVVVACISSSGRQPEDYQNSYLAVARGIGQALASGKLSCEAILWVSSTSVWGQSGTLDEHSPSQPASPTAQVLLQAEQCIEQLACPSLILRFSGLYGPGRHWLLRQWQLGHLHQSPIMTNRLHRQDAQRALMFLAEKLLQGQRLAPLYIATDQNSCTQHELAVFFDQRIKGMAAESQLSDVPWQGKKLSHQALADLGFEWQYPSYRQGYLEIIEEWLKI